MRQEPTILEEVGTLYSFEHVACWVRLTYEWLHLATGKRGVSQVYVLGRSGFHALLCHWNRDPRWKYTAISW